MLGVLGVKWEQLQWLGPRPPGLTVGLGFGGFTRDLRELYQWFNFCFFEERPVRVGDIVTLNNLSGRVSKIKIRANRHHRL